MIVEAPLREPEGYDKEEASPAAAPAQKKETRPAADAKTVEAPRRLTDSLSGIFGNIGEDDILLAALIIILAGEGNEGNREAILLLALLLCIR